jgi:hypothetical protein
VLKKAESSKFFSRGKYGGAKGYLWMTGNQKLIIKRKNKGYNSKEKNRYSKQLSEELIALMVPNKAITSTMMFNTRIIIIFRGLIL